MYKIELLVFTLNSKKNTTTIEHRIQVVRALNGGQNKLYQLEQRFQNCGQPT